MSMFGPKMGSWHVSSETDPRWNGSGRGYGLVSTGGPPGLHEHVKKCKELYGELPMDLETSFWKD